MQCSRLLYTVLCSSSQNWTTLIFCEVVRFCICTLLLISKLNHSDFLCSSPLLYMYSVTHLKTEPLWFSVKYIDRFCILCYSSQNRTTLIFFWITFRSVWNLYKASNDIFKNFIPELRVSLVSWFFIKKSIFHILHLYFYD